MLAAAPHLPPVELSRQLRQQCDGWDMHLLRNCPPLHLTAERGEACSAAMRTPGCPVCASSMPVLLQGRGHVCVISVGCHQYIVPVQAGPLLDCAGGPVLARCQQRVVAWVHPLWQLPWA